MGILDLVGKKNTKKKIDGNGIGNEACPPKESNTTTDKVEPQIIQKQNNACMHADSQTDPPVIEQVNVDLHNDQVKHTDNATSVNGECNNDLCSDSANTTEYTPDAETTNNRENGSSPGAPTQDQNAIVDSSKFASNDTEELDLSSPQELTVENTGFVRMNSDTSTDDNTSWKEMAGRYVFGEQGGTFRQIPFLSRNADKNKYHKPDLIADIAQIGGLLFLGASTRGESHYGFETVRQDSFIIDDCFIGERHYAIAAIADGVGTAAYSDQLADLLVNNISVGLKEFLKNAGAIDSINWKDIANYIWGVSLEFCRKKTGSSNLDDYTEMASTLEFIMIETVPGEKNTFVHVTIAGDGGAYLISGNDWYAVKRGKQKNGASISNEVDCLPDKPCNVTVKYGTLECGEMLFLVTDGLGDGIEESADLRAFFSEKLDNAETLPEFVRIICTSIDQMSDDKTGILIKYCPRRQEND